MKVTIIGHCGSGKTTLAKNISAKLDIPRLELDRLWFKHGGTTVRRSDITAKNEIRDKIISDVRDFLSKNEHWVSDGIYTSAQYLIAEKADLIIYIDIPLWRRQLNHLSRLLRQKDRHSELTFFEDLYFTWDMIRRTKNSKSKINEICDLFPNKVIRLVNYKEVCTYINSL